MKEAKEIFNNLPQWSKGVIAIVVVSGVGLIGYRIYKKIKEINESQNSLDVSDSADGEYKKLLRQGQKLSFPETNYISVANTISQSLSGCDAPTDEFDVVTAIIKTVKKPIDWYFLVKIFGARTIDNCGWGMGESVTALPELLREQLGQNSAYSVLQTNFGFLSEHIKKQTGIII